MKRLFFGVVIALFAIPCNAEGFAPRIVPKVTEKAVANTSVPDDPDSIPPGELSAIAASEKDLPIPQGTNPVENASSLADRAADLDRREAAVAAREKACEEWRIALDEHRAILEDVRKKLVAFIDLYSEKNVTSSEPLRIYRYRNYSSPAVCGPCFNGQCYSE